DLNPTEFAQPLHKSGGLFSQGRSRAPAQEPDGRQLRRLLRPCASHLGREQQTAATTDQSNELTPFKEDRGLPPLCVIGAADWPVLSLPHLQPAPGRPAIPWARPESF